MKVDPNVWNIMTRSRGGTVSLLKNLDETTARNCMQRMGHQRDPWSDAKIREDLEVKAEHQMLQQATKVATTTGLIQVVHSPRGMVYEVRPGGMISTSGGHGGYSGVGVGYSRDDSGDLVQVEVWGPEGAELEIWPKPTDYDERLAKAEAALALVTETNADMARFGAG